MTKSPAEGETLVSTQPVTRRFSLFAVAGNAAQLSGGGQSRPEDEPACVAA
jgi:hypothetical protein